MPGEIVAWLLERVSYIVDRFRHRTRLLIEALLSLER